MARNNKGQFVKGHKEWLKRHNYNGINNPFYGKHHSEESKKKIIKFNIGKHTGNKSNFWKGGISYEPYTVDWTKTLKKSIRERDHYICQICNKEGNSVHHVDYDKKNCNPNNLITLCNPCHIKTNYNRNKWLNYFKEIRRIKIGKKI